MPHSTSDEIWNIIKKDVDINNSNCFKKFSYKTLFTHCCVYLWFQFVNKLEVNPNCDQSWCKGNGTSYTYGMLVHTTAKGPKDLIHHLFSTVGSPTLMMSRTSLDSTLEINYTTLRNGSEESIFYHPKKPEHTFGIIFSKVGCSLDIIFMAFW